MTFFSIFYSFSWSQWLLAFGLGLLFALYFLKKKSYNLPPGPLRLPLIGNLHMIGSELHTSLFNMSKKYGDIYSLYLGKQLFLIVSGRKLFSQMFVNQSVQFSKRPEDLLAGQYLSKGKNFIFSHEMSIEEHKKQKAIAMSALKKIEKSLSLAFPKNHFQQAEKFELQSCLEKVFSEEIIHLGQELVKLGEDYKTKLRFKSNGNEKYTTAVTHCTSISSIRSMYTVILGKRNSPEEEFEKVGDLISELQTKNNTLSLFLMFPFLKRIWKAPFISFASTALNYNNLFECYIDEAKDRIKKSAKANNESTSNTILDVILKMKAESQDESWDDITTLSLVQSIFGGGFDTFSSLSRWLFIYFGIFSDKTKRAQNEVDKFVDDHHHLPRYSDRYDLPYVVAYLTEVMRHSCFIPFTVPHSSVEDTVVNNFFIPKKANIFFCFQSLNWDPDVFSEPQDFRPERFIAEDNSFNKALADKVNVHGAGRRVCAGMNMSKIQGFVSIATLLHMFDCKPLDKNQTKLPRSVTLITTIPKVFNVVVCERNPAQ